MVTTRKLKTFLIFGASALFVLCVFKFNYRLKWQSYRNFQRRGEIASELKQAPHITVKVPVKSAPTASAIKSKKPGGPVCANSAREVKTFDKKSKNGIPLIIHQVYKDTNLPQQYIPLLRGCRRVNKEFLHILWTDADFEKFLATRPAKLQSMYKNYKSPDQRSDFMRLVILEHFGGVYFDLDVECRKPLVQTLDSLNKTCIIDREREMQTRLRWDKDFSAMNSAMIATPGHKFIRYLLEKLNDALKQTHVMWRTGPFFLTDRYLEYNRTAHSHADAVYLAPASLFSPLVDPALFGMFNQKCVGDLKRKLPMHRAACEEWQRQGRKQDEAKEIANSTLVHRFMHLVYTFMSGNIKKRLDACREVQGITRYVV